MNTVAFILGVSCVKGGSYSRVWDGCGRLIQILGCLNHDHTHFANTLVGGLVTPVLEVIFAEKPVT